jgi:quercetin dioxygenase-like cupin family protein
MEEQNESRNICAGNGIHRLHAIPVVAVAELAARDTITRAFSEAIPEISGKSINAIVVTYQPGGKSPPHHHARSAFVIGYVLSGSIRSQVNGGEIHVFHAGEHWTEVRSHFCATGSPETRSRIFESIV